VNGRSITYVRFGNYQKKFYCTTRENKHFNSTKGNESIHESRNYNYVLVETASTLCIDIETEVDIQL
jgi:hypothetical protein